MFTIEQIKAALAQTKSGADFPNYIQHLIQLGIKGYDSYVSNGHVRYFGENAYSLSAEMNHTPLKVAIVSDPDKFKESLKRHQAGKSDFPTFRSECAETGVEKWTVDTLKMTCVYYDGSGHELLAEAIPKV